MDNYKFKVSVMVSTFRPGGLDIILAGMRDQTFPRDQFEVIIVDHRYAKRHKDVMALAQEYGLTNVVHVPEHRTNGKWNTICSAWNTAVALATGEYIIFLQDFAYAPPGWIECHLAKHDDGTVRRLVLGAYYYCDMPPLAPLKIPGFSFADQHPKGARCLEQDAVIKGEVFDEMYIFRDGKFDPSMLLHSKIADYPHQDPRLTYSPTSKANVDLGWVHLKNESIKRSEMWAINGLDERTERGKGPADIDVSLRLRGNGVELFWAADEELRYLIPNPRKYSMTMPYGDNMISMEGRWSWNDGMRYNYMRVHEIADCDPANKAQVVRSKNTYDIEKLATNLRALGWHNPNSNLKSRDVSDTEYWGEVIWPETCYGKPTVNVLVKELIKLMHVNKYVETGIDKGLSLGEVNRWFEELYPEFMGDKRHAKGRYTIYEIDIKDECCRRVNEYYTDIQGPGTNPNVQALCGSSEIILEKMIDQNEFLADDNVIFYLDAHWNAYWPIKDEIKQVLRLTNKPIIIVDDFQVPNRSYDWDAYEGKPLNIELLRELFVGRCDAIYYSDIPNHGNRSVGIFFVDRTSDEIDKIISQSSKYRSFLKEML